MVEPMTEPTAYERLISTLESQIADLKQEKVKLMDMVHDCFKALTAKESPMYYNDTREKEFRKTPEQLQEEKKRDMQSKFYNEYVNQVEQGELFGSPDDLKSMLERLDKDDIISKVMPLTVDSAASLHDNDES